MNPKLIVRSGPAKGLVYEIVNQETAIGRHESNSFDLPDRQVSRNHCRLVRQGDKYLLQDLSSRNGTYVFGSPIKEVELKHKDEIRIGESWLLFLLHEEESEMGSSLVRFLDNDTQAQSKVFLQSQESHYLSALNAPVGSGFSPRTEQNYQMLLLLGREINSIRDSNQLQHRLLELIFTVIPAERGAILMIDPGAEKFASRVVRFRHELQTQNQEIIISRTILNRAKNEDGGILTVRVEPETLPENEMSLVTSGAKSVLAARLAITSEVFGILYLDTTNFEVVFDQEHLQLLTAIANLAAGALETARYVERLKAEKERLQKELDFDRQMIGDCPPMKIVRQLIAKVATADTSVLIRGESGTGKELVAHAIHKNSARKEKPFIAINCAALPENLIESELFGYEKGAFTGAVSRKLGKFESADSGTIFLDEIGDLKSDLQAKLLRVLQEGEIERLGGTQAIKVDVRVVAATNKNLEAEMRSGNFREDLFYRLNVLTIKMPPLRERPDDIQQLANYFVEKYSVKCKRRIRGISAQARACLQRYVWPGNVRELENIIERAIVLAETDQILPEDLPEKVLEYEPEITENDKPTPIYDSGAVTHPLITTSATNLLEAVKEAKKQIILDTIKRTEGSRTAAAELLGIHPNNLDRLIRELNLRAKLKTSNSAKAVS